MTLLSKNLYIGNVADIVMECNNIYHTTLKMQPIDVKSSTYIQFDAENNDEDPRLV